ncbi:hypothetical protein [Peribacillus sp. NPDC096540]
MQDVLKRLMMELNHQGVTIESNYSHSDQEEIVVVMKGECYVELEG